MYQMTNVILLTIKNVVAKYGRNSQLDWIVLQMLNNLNSLANFRLNNRRQMKNKLK